MHRRPVKEKYLFGWEGPGFRKNHTWGVQCSFVYTLVWELKPDVQTFCFFGVGGGGGGRQGFQVKLICSFRLASANFCDGPWNLGCSMIYLPGGLKLPNIDRRPFSSSKSMGVILNSCGAANGSWHCGDVLNFLRDVTQPEGERSTEVS